jgi:16S rRNA (uracil1498-N3)-methyltransferase
VKVPRIFVSQQEMTPTRVVFSEKSTRYLRNVLRLKAGDLVSVFDGVNFHDIVLTESSRQRICGDVIESGHEDSRGLDICLAFGCVRPGPVEEILRHGTELGVSVFIPIISCRVNRKPQERKDRWHTIVVSASAQSGRTAVPAVEAPVSLNRLFQRDFACDTKLLLSTDRDAKPILEILHKRTHKRVKILVGPEGGFDGAEESGALAAGFLPVSLGRCILRTETAALAAVAAVAAWYDSLQREGKHALSFPNTTACMQRTEQADEDLGLT